MGIEFKFRKDGADQITILDGGVVISSITAKPETINALMANDETIGDNQELRDMLDDLERTSEAEVDWLMDDDDHYVIDEP